MPASVVPVGGPGDVEPGEGFLEGRKSRLQFWIKRGRVTSRSTYIDLEDRSVSSGTSGKRWLLVPGAGGGCPGADVPPLQSCVGGGVESDGNPR